MNLDLETIAQQTPTKPEAVIDAEAFAAAADELLTQVATKTAPDLTAATTATIAKVHKAAVAFTVARAVELEHATALTTLAEQRVAQAWFDSTSSLHAGFAAEFDETADALVAESSRIGDPDPEAVAAEHWNPQYAKLRELSGRLDQLGVVRDAYANLGGRPDAIISTDYEKQSRLLELPSEVTLIRILSILGHTRNGVRYWLTVSRRDGVRIKWQTPAQQAAQPACLPVLAQRERMTELANR